MYSPSVSRAYILTKLVSILYENKYDDAFSMYNKQGTFTFTRHNFSLFFLCGT